MWIILCNSFKILDFFDPFSDELGSWYNFLWDRTRAIRKEITQLMLSNELAVSLLERFLIHFAILTSLVVHDFILYVPISYALKM